MIADDNVAVLTAMHYLLDSTFEQILTISQPDEILKLMAQQAVDLVLLDMNFTLGVNTGNEGSSGFAPSASIIPSLLSCC